VDEELAELLNATPDPERPYMYRGTRTHINKFGILNPDALERVVRAITDLRVELLKQWPVHGEFDMKHLCAVHYYLFQDIYEWAGRTRVVEFDRDGTADPMTILRNTNFDVTNAKPAGPPFKRVAQIESEANRVLDDLRQDSLAGLDIDAFSIRLAHYLAALYLIHPFRDGNGRTIRCFLRQLAASLGWTFDLDRAPQVERHVTAFTAHCGDPAPLRKLIRDSLQPLDSANPQRS
jgi:cell filamentation protein